MLGHPARRLVLTGASRDRYPAVLSVCMGGPVKLLGESLCFLSR